MTQAPSAANTAQPRILPSDTAHSFLFVDVRPTPPRPQPVNALHHLGKRLLAMLTGSTATDGWQAWSETTLETRISTDFASIKSFGALLIEAATTDPGQNADEDQVQSLLQQLDQICHQADGIWQLRSQNRIGCVVPSYAAEGLEKIGASLQTKAAPAIKLTIGMAIAPTLDYPAITIPANAEKALEHALLLGAGEQVLFDAISLNVAGDRLYAEGKIDAARDEFQQALLIDANDTNVLNSLGVCYGMLGQYQEAHQQFEKALQIDPQEGMALFNQGMLSLLQGSPAQATEALKRAAPLLENDLDTGLQIGRAYLQVQRPDLAHPYLERVIQQNPVHGAGLGLLGQSLYQLGRSTEAKPMLKKALRQIPDDAASLSALGALLADQTRDLTIAVLYAEQSVTLDPQNGLHRLRLGRIYLQTKEFARALSEFEQAQQLGHPVAAEMEKATAAMKTQVPN